MTCNKYIKYSILWWFLTKFSDAEALSPGLLRPVLGMSEALASQSRRIRVQGCRYVISLKSVTVNPTWHTRVLHCDTPHTACVFVGAGLTAGFKGQDELLSPR